MEWHYGLADTPHGPISDEQLLELVRKGTVCPDTLVWTEYLVDWVPAEEVEGLFLAAGVAEPALTAVGTDSPWAEKPQLINTAKPKADSVSASQAFARIWEKPTLSRPKESTAAFTPQERRPESPRTNALAGRPRTGPSTRHPSGEIGQRPQPDPGSPASTAESPHSPTGPNPPASPPADSHKGMIPSPFSQSDTAASTDQTQVPTPVSPPPSDPPKLPELNPFTTPPPGAAPEPAAELPSPEQPPTISEAPADQPKLPELNPFTTPPPGAAPEPAAELPSPEQPPAISEAPADQPKLPELNPFTTPPPGAAPEPAAELPSPEQPPATSEAPADQPKLPELNPFTTPPPGAAPEPAAELPSPEQPPATSEAPADQPKLPELNPFTTPPPGAAPEPAAELEPSESPKKVEPAAKPGKEINPFTQAPPPSAAELEKVADEAKKAQEIQRAEDAAKKAKLPKKKSAAAPKPLAGAPKGTPKGTSKSTSAPVPAPTVAPASVQREKSGVTAPLEKSASPQTGDDKENPEAPVEGSSNNWKRPEDSTTKRRRSIVPFLVKSALVLALSAGSAFGLHSYRSHLAAQVPEEPPPPPPVVTPPPVVEKSLAYLVARLGSTDFQNILFWQIGAADGLPGWLEEATPLPLLDNLRSPTELPEWVFSSSPETVLVAQFPGDPSPGSAPLSPLTIIRVPKDVAAGLLTYFPQSAAIPLAGGEELIPASPAANSAGTAGVYLDKRTLAVAPEATIRALFDREKPAKPDSAILGLVESFKDTAPVIVADRQILPNTDVTASPQDLPPTTQIWEATLYSADEKRFVLEQATISIGGPPPVGSPPPAPVPHPDLLLDRILLGSEIDQVKGALRTTKPRFPDARIAVLPKELFLDQNNTPAPSSVPPQPYRYLPDFYRAVVTHDLKKLRENPRFNEFRTGTVNRPHYWRELDQVNYGLLARDLDQIHSCASELGNCHVLVARFPLTVEHFGKSVDPLGGYTVKGLQLYPVQPRSSTETLYLCIIEERVAVIAPGAMLDRIIRQAGEPSPLQPYMEEIYPMASEFEESLFLRVEGRTGDVRYHGVQALFFGENYDPDGYDSRRVIKCRNASMAEEFNRLMRRRREDAAAEKVGTSVADLLSVGMDEGNLVIGAKIPDDLWETYTTYFKNVILPEG